MIMNIGTGRGGGSGGTLTITAPVGGVVTITKDDKTTTKTVGANGTAVFKGVESGTWTVTLSDPTGEQNDVVTNIVVTADYSTTMAYFAAYITATYPEGSACTCTKGDIVFNAPDTSGSVVFTVPEVGDWVVACTDGTDTADQTITITEDGQSESVNLGYQLYASDFSFFLDEGTTTPATLGTDYSIVYDDDTDIPQSEWTTAKNWKVRNLVTLYCKPEKDGEIDVFCVGGGGSGGKENSDNGSIHSSTGAGGGYTTTGRNISVKAGETYPITIGSGAQSAASDGGQTSAFGITANGGKHGNNGYKASGGNGGSGGGTNGVTSTGGKGGSDGGNGNRNTSNSESGTPGTGQGTTTREFGEAGARLYAGGGGGGSNYHSGYGPGAGGDGGGGAGSSTKWNNGGAGGTNTGGGGGAGSGKGGSGIVVFRNAREVA